MASLNSIIVLYHYVFNRVKASVIPLKSMILQAVFWRLVLLLLTFGVCLLDCYFIWIFINRTLFTFMLNVVFTVLWCQISLYALKHHFVVLTEIRAFLLPLCLYLFSVYVLKHYFLEWLTISMATRNQV